MAAAAIRPVAIKIDDDTTARLKRLADARHRTAHWLMREAITQYVEREERREAFRQDTLKAWDEYRSTGLHVTADEADTWLADLELGKDTEPPGCRVCSGAVTLIQRFGSAANLNIHLHCPVLDGVYRRSADGTPDYGFRTNARGGGHHQMAIQCLKHTPGVDDGRIQVIDGLRKQRYLADYEGDTVNDAALSECIRQATDLLPRVEDARKTKGWT